MPPTRPNNFLNTASTSNPSNVPGNNFDLNQADPFRTLGIIFLIVSIFLSGISYGVLYYFKSSNLKIENSIKSAEASLSNVPLENMLAFSNKIKSINLALKNHNYITTQLNTLSDVVEKDTYFKNFSFSTKENGDGEISLSAITQDESNIVRQMDRFRSEKYRDFIKTVELKSISKDNLDNISFEIKLIINSTVKPDYIILENSMQNKKEVEIKKSTPISATSSVVNISFGSPDQVSTPSSTITVNSGAINSTSSIISSSSATTSTAIYKIKQ